MPHAFNDNDDIDTPATATAPTLPPFPNVTAPANTTEPEQADVSLELDFNFDAEEKNCVNESESIAPTIKKKRRGGKNKTSSPLNRKKTKREEREHKNEDDLFVDADIELKKRVEENPCAKSGCNCLAILNHAPLRGAVTPGTLWGWTGSQNTKRTSS